VNDLAKRVQSVIECGRYDAMLKRIETILDENKIPPSGVPVWCEHMVWDKGFEWQLRDCRGAREVNVFPRTVTADRELTIWNYCPICGAKCPETTELMSGRKVGS
jgi:hypothetical protein